MALRRYGTCRGTICGVAMVSWPLRIGQCTWQPESRILPDSPGWESLGAHATENAVTRAAADLSDTIAIAGAAVSMQYDITGNAD